MMHRSARCHAAAVLPSLRTRVLQVSRQPSFLRRAPPSVYVTCDPSPAEGSSSRPLRRHCTHVLDTHANVGAAESDDRMPLTSAVFALRSTAIEDTALVDTAASSTLLVDVPALTDTAAWTEFLRSNANELSGLHTVALTTLQPHTSSAVKQLLSIQPDVVVCCSPFLSALLTDAVFFAGVKRAVMERVSHSPEAVHAMHETMQFAALKDSQVRTVAHGESILTDTKVDSSDAIARRLVAVHVTTAAEAGGDGRQGAEGRTRRTAAAPFFAYTPIYYHDDTLGNIHVGDTLARLPWLPSVVPEVAREEVWPCPPLLARRGVRAGASEARDGPLLHTWRVEDEAAAVAAALRTVPTAQHVLCSHYGALDGDVEEVCLGLVKNGHHLEQLRSRLARRLETDTARDPAQWTGPLLGKIVNEVLRTQTAHPATSPDTLAQVLEWARTPQSTLSDLAEALAYAAVMLPPSPVDHPDQPARPRAQTPPRTSEETERRSLARSPASVPTESGHAHSDGANDLTGAKGVTLLQAILTKKGLHGLGKAAARESVDIPVFLAMSAADFRRVFKTTAGVSRKLELLQAEIRANMP